MGFTGRAGRIWYMFGRCANGGRRREESRRGTHECVRHITQRRGHSTRCFICNFGAGENKLSGFGAEVVEKFGAGVFWMAEIPERVAGGAFPYSLVAGG